MRGKDKEDKVGKPVDDHYLERCLRSALQPGTPIEDNS
ncbi:hypothetical protein ABIA95_009106 [Bradyrhizobium sp. LA8.1]